MEGRRAERLRRRSRPGRRQRGARKLKIKGVPISCHWSKTLAGHYFLASRTALRLCGGVRRGVIANLPAKIIPPKIA